MRRKIQRRLFGTNRLRRFQEERIILKVYKDEIYPDTRESEISFNANGLGTEKINEIRARAVIDCRK